MKSISATIFAVFLLLLCPKLWAQTRIDGEFRIRSEFRNGYSGLPGSSSSPVFITGQRSRLQIEYRKDWLKTKMGIQDVRIWGDEKIYNKTGVFGDQSSLDLNEAWIELSFLKNASLKVGRQYFDYDDSRLLSNRNWNNNSVKYDAVLFSIVNEKYQLQTAWSFNNENDVNLDAFYPSGKMKSLGFARFQYNLTPSLYASILALGSGFTSNDSSETIYVRGSYGIYISYRNSGINSWFSYYHQNGKNAQGTNVRAWNLNARADRSEGRIRPGFGFSLISGNRLTDVSNDNLFDLHYGVRHATYGYMDYFSNLPKSTGGGGLNDFYAVVDLTLSEKLNLIAEYHYFRLNSRVNNPTSLTVNFYDYPLGSEIDLWFRLRFSQMVSLNGGYSIMLPTGTLQLLQQTDTRKSAHWGWLQLTVKPVFLTYQ